MGSALLGPSLELYVTSPACALSRPPHTEFQSRAPECTDWYEADCCVQQCRDWVNLALVGLHHRQEGSGTVVPEPGVSAVSTRHAEPTAIARVSQALPMLAVWLVGCRLVGE